MLWQRVITALLMAPLALLVILWIPHTFTMAVFALLVLAGAWEWAAFTGLASIPARVAYAALVALAIAAVWIVGTQDVRLDIIIVVAIGWWLLALFWVALLPTRMSRVLGFVAGFLVLIPAWLALVRLHDRDPHLALFLLLVVVAADVGAYFSGRQFGRHKLAPKVSPAKTWEGVYGGLAASAVLAVVGVVWFRISAPPFLAVCALVVLASIVGDLTESLFKRHAGLKDSGSLLPGHGGVLDRVDSVTAAAPVFLFSLERLGLLS
jgi:phosphatidate cytidylyltransferase